MGEKNYAISGEWLARNCKSPTRWTSVCRRVKFHRQPSSRSANGIIFGLRKQRHEKERGRKDGRTEGRKKNEAKTKSQKKEVPVGEAAAEDSLYTV